MNIHQAPQLYLGITLFCLDDCSILNTKLREFLLDKRNSWRFQEDAEKNDTAVLKSCETRERKIEV